MAAAAARRPLPPPGGHGQPPPPRDRRAAEADGRWPASTCTATTCSTTRISTSARAPRPSAPSRSSRRCATARSPAIRSTTAVLVLHVPGHLPSRAIGTSGAGGDRGRGRGRVSGEQLELTEPGREGAGAAQADGPPPPDARAAAAIEARDRDVLLEAGAGTGKTGVMVDRYCAAAVRGGRRPRRDPRLHLHRAAAAELRQRIRAELSRRARKRASEGDGERAARLASSPATAARLDHDHPRLLQPAARGPPGRPRDRPPLPRARRAGGGPARQRAFDEALEELLGEGDRARRAGRRDAGAGPARSFARHTPSCAAGARAGAARARRTPTPQARSRTWRRRARPPARRPQGGRGGARNLDAARSRCAALDPAATAAAPSRSSPS